MASEWMPPISIGDSGDFLLEGCQFSDNTNNSVETSNAIFQIGTSYDNVDYLRIRIRNCLFSNSHQANMTQMANIVSYGAMSYIENCTFVNNTGGSNTIFVNGDVTLKNNIFYNPELPYEIVIPDFTNNGLYSNVWLGYNDIRNGQNGVLNTTSLNHLYWGDGNISDNPMFTGIGTNPYYLSAASPLIDAGDPEQHIGSLMYDIAGNERIWDGNNDGIARIDIGAYEYQLMSSPANLAAGVSVNSVYLSWTMDLNRAISGYRVYRDSVAIADIDNPHWMEYTDTAFTESDTVTYRVVALYGTIESEPSNSVTVYLEYVHNDDNVAPAVSSFRISPNPFSNFTVIRYTVGNAGSGKGDVSRDAGSGKRDGAVSLAVYNLKGQKIKTITHNSYSKGEQVTYWDGRDDNGKACSTGIYIVKLMLDGKTVSSKKATLVK